MHTITGDDILAAQVLYLVFCYFRHRFLVFISSLQLLYCTPSTTIRSFSTPNIPENLCAVCIASLCGKGFGVCIILLPSGSIILKYHFSALRSTHVLPMPSVFGRNTSNVYCPGLSLCGSIFSISGMYGLLHFILLRGVIFNPANALCGGKAVDL